MQLKLGFILLLSIYLLISAPATRAEILLDPTRPVVDQKPVAKKSAVIRKRSWTLESILVSPERRVAVINGQVVGEGESVEGALILKISKFDVLIKTRSKRITLQLLPDILLKQP